MKRLRLAAARVKGVVRGILNLPSWTSYIITQYVETEVDRVMRPYAKNRVFCQRCECSAVRHGCTGVAARYDDVTGGCACGCAGFSPPSRFFFEGDRPPVPLDETGAPLT